MLLSGKYSQTPGQGKQCLPEVAIVKGRVIAIVSVHVRRLACVRGPPSCEGVSAAQDHQAAMRQPCPLGRLLEPLERGFPCARFSESMESPPTMLGQLAAWHQGPGSPLVASLAGHLCTQHLREDFRLMSKSMAGALATLGLEPG